MEKIDILIPKKINIAHDTVVVSETVFNNFIEIINLQTTAINGLIDAVEAIDSKTQENVESIQVVRDSVQALAKAFKTYLED